VLQKNNLILIEDAAEALYSKYKKNYLELLEIFKRLVFTQLKTFHVGKEVRL
jgi:dTDP-4-amino-4,6-dideoxygalactose transaminase